MCNNNYEGVSKFIQVHDVNYRCTNSKRERELVIYGTSTATVNSDRMQ